MKICARPDCGNEFEPVRANKIFCSNECQRINTTARLMKQYYERKERRAAGATRQCKTCTTILSRYNDKDQCSVCRNAVVFEANRQAKLNEAR